MYSILKGNMWITYDGTSVCTGIIVHKVVATIEEAKKEAAWLYEYETDLITVINLDTGNSEEV